MDQVKRLKPIKKDRLRPSNDGWYHYYAPDNETEAISCSKEIEYEQRYYSAARLNEGQRRIYDYVHANPRAMIIIQAGPGTGKTFTLLSLAHSWRNKATCYAIIYKHDLLLPFRYVARRYTVAKFVMETLGLRYFQYQALEIQLSGRLSGVEFIAAIVALLRRARLPDMLGSLVILDEYTVVPKPLLLLMLLLLKAYNIGTIICGDRNQLQNIHNSTHTRVSSFELARRLADATFTLDINERCRDSRYNRIIDYVAGFSSDRCIDEFACSLVAAIFPRQLLGTSTYADTHLAATHRELTQVVHNIVINDNIPTSFYYIEPSASLSLALAPEDARLTSSGLLRPQLLLRYTRDRAPDKFLPYLPLCVGAKYYLFTHSETTQGTLKRIDEATDTLIFELYGDRTIDLRKCPNNNVVFEPHRLELLGEDRGTLFNFPVYPANIMTVHKCQGCTIQSRLDLHLANVTHQGLYVALSRVRDPQQIVRITMPNAVSHLCSVIVNFPELCDDRQLDVDVLTSRFDNFNYILYQPGGGSDISRIVFLIANFFDDDVTTDARRSIRDKLVRLLTVEQRCAQRIVAPVLPPEETNATTLLRFLEHRDVLVSLIALESIDRIVWLHEYVRATPSLMPLITMEANAAATTAATTTIESGSGGNVLATVANLNNHYPMSRSTVTYLKSRAKQEVRLLDASSPEYANQRDRTIYHEGDGDYLAILTGSKFQARLYKKLVSTNDAAPSIEWLMRELKVLQADALRQREFEPEKMTTTTRSPSPKRTSSSSSILLHHDIDTRFLPINNESPSKRRKQRRR